MGKCTHMHGGMGHRGFGHRKMAWLWKLKHLDLSDEQWQRLHAIKFATLKAVARQWAEVKVAKIDLVQLLHEENVDRARVEDAVREVGRLRTDLKLTLVNAMLDAFAVLTADQRRKLRSFGMHADKCCPICGSEMGAEEGEEEETAEEEAPEEETEEA